jgi:NTE family protein
MLGATPSHRGRRGRGGPVRSITSSTRVAEEGAVADGPVAFVLGGGGTLGANEVGMLRALMEAGIVPDLILGTSIGAINGAVIATLGATPDAVEHLTDLWTTIGDEDIFAGSVFARVGTLVRSGTHLYDPEPLRELLKMHLHIPMMEDLPVPFQCVAASIERAAPHWFTDGQLVDAVLASSAVPGLFPPVRIDDEHFLDGGLVHSVPIGRAVRLGAATVYVLHVGRVEEPLTPPTNPLQVALVAFEIARRYRFVEETARLSDEVELHVLPTGGEERTTSLGQQLRYSDFSAVGSRIERAYEAAAAYLQGPGT